MPGQIKLDPFVAGRHVEFFTSVFDNTKPFLLQSTPLAVIFQRPTGTHEAILVLNYSMFPQKPMHEASFQMPFRHIIVHKSGHSSAPPWNVKFLEQTLYTLSPSPVYVKIGVHWYCLLFCMADKYRTCTKVLSI